jgi:hypothetical protein
MDNDTREQQVRRLERTADYYYDQGAYEVSKEFYSRANKLRMGQPGQSLEGYVESPEQLIHRQSEEKFASLS